MCKFQEVHICMLSCCQHVAVHVWQFAGSRICTCSRELGREGQKSKLYRISWINNRIMVLCITVSVGIARMLYPEGVFSVHVLINNDCFNTEGLDYWEWVDTKWRLARTMSKLCPVGKTCKIGTHSYIGTVLTPPCSKKVCVLYVLKMSLLKEKISIAWQLIANYLA